MADERQSLGDKIDKGDIAALRTKGAGLLSKDAVLSSGLFWVDNVSGGEGLFPSAAITEVAGLQAVGKTTLVLHTIAYNQWLYAQYNRKFRVLYMDNERNLSYQRELALAIGVDVGDANFFYRRSGCLESSTQYIIDCLRPHTRKLYLGIEEPLDLVVYDTVAAARAKVEIDNKIGGTAKPGYRGKLWAEAFRGIQAELCINGGPAVVAINHLQQLIEMTGFSMGPPKFESPASNALKIYAAQRYFLTKKEKAFVAQKVEDPVTFDTYEVPYATCAEIYTDKSKVGTPYRRAPYHNRPTFGVDTPTSLVEAAKRHGRALYVSSNNAQFGVPYLFDDKGAPVESSCKKKVVGYINFLEYLASPDGLADLRQLASRLGELWAAQVNAWVAMRARGRDLLARDVQIAESKNTDVPDDHAGDGSPQEDL